MSSGMLRPTCGQALTADSHSIIDGRQYRAVTILQHFLHNAIAEVYGTLPARIVLTWTSSSKMMLMQDVLITADSFLSLEAILKTAMQRILLYPRSINAIPLDKPTCYLLHTRRPPRKVPVYKDHGNKRSRSWPKKEIL